MFIVRVRDGAEDDPLIEPEHVSGAQDDAMDAITA